VSAQVVDLAERRRVRALANTLVDMANGRAEDLVSLQQLMNSHPGLALRLVREVMPGRLTLELAADIARRWLASHSAFPPLPGIEPDAPNDDPDSTVAAAPAVATPASNRRSD